MKKQRLAQFATASLCGVLLLSGCGAKKNVASSTMPSAASPSSLSTPADMWADLDSLKAEVRRLSASMDELRFQVDSIAGSGNGESLVDRVSVLEANVAQVASQLAIELERPAPRATQQSSSMAAPMAPNPEMNATPTTLPVVAPPAQTPQQIMEPTRPEENDSVVYEAQKAYVPSTGTSQTATVASTNTASNSPKDMYERGLEAFKSRQYDQALSVWKNFVTSYPSDALAPNAVFWQGEAYYQKGDFANAALMYQDVIEKYPSSNKFPAAMLKQGISFIRMGNKSAGGIVLKDLISKYPNSAEATRAKGILTSL